MNKSQGFDNQGYQKQDEFEYIKQFIDICCEGDLTEKEFEEISGILRKVYGDGKYRHRYSEIARYLGTKQTADISEVLCDSLIQIEKSNAYQDLIKNGNGQKIKVSAEKLFDTLDLEIYRLTREKGIEEKLKTLKYGEDIGETIQDAEQKMKELSEDVTKASEVAKTASEDARRVNAQSMSTLGVFTAIMFAFSGGFSLIGGAFSTIVGITRNEMLLMVSLVLFVGGLLADIIIALMWFLARVQLGTDDKFKGAKKWVIILNVIIAIVISFMLILNYSTATDSRSRDSINKSVENEAGIPNEYDASGIDNCIDENNQYPGNDSDPAE